MTTAAKIIRELKKLSSPVKRQRAMSFFKTGFGQYGAGDVFIGVTVPEIRWVARQYLDISLIEVEQLLASEIHEVRLCALLILVAQYQLGDDKLKKKIYNFYLAHLSAVNNWDLVDLSADKIIGAYLFNHSSAPLLKLARSNSLWARRVSIVATFYHIRNNQFDLTLQITNIFIVDQHDLIHKATGWMLREVGKRSRATLVEFLRKNYQQMPRTMLRYSIEHFDKGARDRYLKGSIN